MDAKQFLAIQLEDAGYQLEKCYEGISDTAMNLKVCEVAMTPKEILIHLGDVYKAFLAIHAGEKYEWGSYQPKDVSWSEVAAMRKVAVTSALASDSEDGMKMANAYILGHDNYHVGQVCLARIQSEPGFDPYSIYPHE